MNPNTKFYKFIENRKLAYALSTTLILTGFIFMAIRSLQAKPILNWGIDFVGGSTISFTYQSMRDAMPTAQDRDALVTTYIQKTRDSLKKIGEGNASIMATPENEFIIKTSSLNSETIKHIQEQLTQDQGPIDVHEVDFIGPTIGNELKQKSGLIIGSVITALLLYITFRFRFAYGLGAIAALLHDALATISLAAIFNFEIDSAFVAALLTVLGYSMNDTIIIFDRIRENLAHTPPKHIPNIIAITNASLTQTLSRTINTVATALLMLLAMIIFGGSTLRTFLLVMFLGIMIGTYSSLFIASPVFVRFFKHVEPEEE